MIKFLSPALVVASLFVTAPAFAQSTATPVVDGYLTTSGCSYGQTTCFVQYGSAVPVTATIAPIALTTTNASGTITSGGTFQSILASSATRKGCLIQNPTTATEPLFVFFGVNGSATTANSISLGPGASVSCAVGGLGVATDNVSATATTTSHAYVEMSQ